MNGSDGKRIARLGGLIRRPFAARPEKMGLIALGVFAIALRFVRLGQESFWFDEIYSLKAITAPEGVLRFTMAEESSPPLFFYLLKGWSLFFGQSFTALRAFSAVTGGLCAPLFWVCARRWRLPAWGAWAAALMLAVNPMHYFLAQQNRYYAVLFLTGILWLSELPAALAGRSARPHWPFVLTGFLCLCTHYYFAFLAIAAGAGALAWSLFARERPPVLKRVLSNFFTLGGAMLLLTPLVLHHSHNNSPMRWAQPPAWRDLLSVYAMIFWSGPRMAVNALRLWLPVALELAALIGIISGFARARRPNPQGEDPGSLSLPAAAVYLAWLSMGAAFLTFVFSLLVAPLFLAERYTLLFLPPFILAVVAGWTLWPGRRTRWVAGGAVALTVLISLSSLQNYWRYNQMFKWNKAIRRIARQWRPGDLVAVAPSWMECEFLYNGGEKKKLTAASTLDAARRAKRVWLARSEWSDMSRDAALLEFLAHYPKRTDYEFQFTRIECYDLSSAAPAASESSSPHVR